jgi:uncharacterized protein
MTDVAYRRVASCLAFVAAAAICQPVGAAEVALYRVTVPLNGNTEADRTTAFAEALRAVVVRASGQRDAGSNPVVASRAGRANQLVQQYSATPNRELRVGFEADTIDEILQNANLPSWPSERPVTLVILAVTGVAGGARAVRSGESSPERSQLEQAARARGVPLTWPTGELRVDAVRAQLEASGQDAVSTTAGSRADAVLIGSAAGGKTEWTLVHAGRVAQRRGSIADGAHLAADSFADRYAPASTLGLSTATVRVDGIDTLQAYAGLMDELESLSLVRRVVVAEVDRASVRLLLTLRGDLELLRRIALLTPALRPTVGAGDGAPDFVYQP